jgi:hypothetical protein
MFSSTHVQTTKTLIGEYDNRRPSKKQIDINQVVWISHYRYIVKYRYYHVVCSNEKWMIDVSCYYHSKKKLAREKWKFVHTSVFTPNKMCSLRKEQIKLVQSVIDVLLF